MRKNLAIKVDNISKFYKIYNRARDRVKEAFNPFKKKYYNEHYVLENLNLEIEKGDVLGIFGLNGAGKSTLLKIIAGVVTPSKGRVTVSGSINAMLEVTGSLNPELTGTQNINFNLDLNRIKGEDRASITKDIVDFAEIGSYIEQPVKSYSSGMKARLGFGITTSIEPDILIVDEVLAVGDAVFQQKCFLRIRKLLEKNKTVVFVSHSVELMVEFCNRAIFLYDRNIVFDGPAVDVANYYRRVLLSEDKHKEILSIQNKLNMGLEAQKNISTKRVIGDIPDNFVGYKDANIVIHNVMICDTHDNEKSYLSSFQEYFFKFAIDFKQDFNNVEISCIMMDVTGKKLPWVSHGDCNVIPSVRAGDKYIIKNSFKCNVYNGFYTLNIVIKSIDLENNHIVLVDASDKYKYKFEVANIVKPESSLSFQKI